MTDCGSVSVSPSRPFTPSAAPASLQPAEALSPRAAALVPPTHHVLPSAVVPIIHPSSLGLHVLSLSLSFYSFNSESAESAHTPAHSNEQ